MGDRIASEDGGGSTATCPAQVVNHRATKRRALAARLADLGAAALVEAISLCSSGLSRPQLQDHSKATYAPKLDRELAHLAWQRDAAALVRQIRAFDPAPGAWANLNGGTLKLFGATQAPGSGEPGTVLETGGRSIAAGSVRSGVEVQPRQTRYRSRPGAGRGVTVGRAQ